ncbi:MAG TPA: phage portal protein, partial [Candidatus Dormibacteraeota bacterium]|nr:phage portal protein [Candidatus Dormibacteraeota bacterium]
MSRAPKRKGGNFQPVPVSGGGWWPIIREPFTGAWQRNQEERADTLLTHSAVFACATLIASDIAKMNLRLVKQDADGIWEETSSPSFSPVLQRPNHYQNRIKFIEWWIISKLIHGNTYALKARDNRGVVTALYILDPARVRVLLAPDGSVFYSLGVDVLNGLTEPVVVPAREIIHDIMVALYHPLLGVSPIFACAMAAIQGLRIQANSTRFFANGSNPGGVLSAPGEISQPTADRIKAYWDTNFTGDNVGKIAVLGDGLKYEPMTVNAHDAQLIEQLKWTVETVCSCFHVPAYMIGGALPPNYNNIEALNQQYYSQCLQALIESLELCLDEGLDLPDKYDTQFDLDDLLRMDTATMITSEKDAIGAGIKKPNESRRRLNLKPVDG